MKLCSKCDNSPLPFIMAFLIAAISAFMTWLTLGLSIPEVAPRAGASALAFAVIGGGLLTYILNCLKRHCHHQHDDARDGADPLGERPVAPRATAITTGDLGASGGLRASA